MRRTIIAAALVITASAAHASSVTPDVIFGSGNANGGFTIGKGGGVEIGLRGKLRFDANNTPQNIFNFAGTDGSGVGQYNFATGAAPTGFGWDANSPTTPIWNIDWSINSNYNGAGDVLNAFNYSFMIDGDPTAGTDFTTIFDPINVSFADHGIGTNTTGNGAGVEATDAANYASLIGENNVAQNSLNFEFFNEASDALTLSQLIGFDPNTPGKYRISLSAFTKNTGELVARSEIDINVGAVPLPASGLLLFGALGALAFARRYRTA